MKKPALFITILIIVAFMGNVNAQRILVTVAGNGFGGYIGDGNAAKQTYISAPIDVCIDAASNMYISAQGKLRVISGRDGVIGTIPSLIVGYICIDASGNLYLGSGMAIKKFNTVTGVITTIAGNGTSTFSGDGGPATAAGISVMGVCVGTTGNIFFVDTLGKRIRKIEYSTGIITTIAGTGIAGYTGDGGAATAATLSAPIDICVNSVGDVFFSDQNGCYIRKISASTGIITTIAGDGSIVASGDGGLAINAGIGRILGMCTDGNDDIYIDDYSCSCRKITMATGIIRIVAGTLAVDGYNGDEGNAMVKFLYYPHGVFVDGKSNIYIADSGNNRIRKAVQLTHNPTFAYGKGQYISQCAGTNSYFKDLLGVADIDHGQIEKWSVIDPPAHGSLSGFPATATSGDTVSLAKPSSVVYTSSGLYAGPDSFRIRATDETSSDTITIYVDVAPYPNPGVISGPSTICLYAVDTFSVTSSGGTWSTSNTHIVDVNGTGGLTANGPGAATISYTVYNGNCVASATKIITVMPLPYAGTINSPEQICVGQSVNCSYTAMGGVWSAVYGNASVSAAGVVTGLSQGVDSINYTVTNSCGTARTSNLIDVLECTETSVVTMIVPAINIFPTPASGVLNIEWGSVSVDNASVVISDITGRIVFQGQLPGNTKATQLDISVLNNGIYMLTIRSNTIHFNNKLIISKQ